MSSWSVYDIAYNAWIYRGVSDEWIASRVSEGEELRHTLEAYRSQHGHYPSALSDLPEVPHGRPGEHPWHYKCYGSGQNFEVWTSTCHWVSSFDVLVLESTGKYAGWADNRHTKSRDGWVYVVGGSDYVRTNP